MPREIEVIVYKDRATDWFWAHIVQLPGCFATGRSLDELHDSLEEVVRDFLQSRDSQAALWTDHLEEVLHFRLSDDDDLIPI